MKLKREFKTVVVLLVCLFIVVLIQNISALWHLIEMNGFEYILHALTYIILSYVVVKWFIEKLLKGQMNHYRILPVKFYVSCFVAGMYGLHVSI